MRIQLKGRSRRIAIGAGIGLGVAVVLGGALAWWAPRMVRERVATAAAARGLRADVEGVSVGLGAVEIDSLLVNGAKGEAFAVKASGVSVDAGLFALAFRGTRAVEGVRLGGLSVRVTLDDATRALLDGLRGGARTGDGDGGAARSAPSIAVEELVLTVDDAQGELVEAKGRFEAGRGEAKLELARVQVGEVPAAELVLSGVAIEAARGEGPLALTRGVVRKAELRLAEAGPEQAAPGILDALGEDPEEEGPEQGGEEEAGAGDAPAPEAAAPPVEPAGLPTTRDRVFAAIRWVGGEMPSDEPASAGGGGSAQDGGGAQALFERLGAEAKLSLEDAHVYGDDGAPVLQALRAEVSVAGREALRLAGSGKAQGGGVLSWDVRLWPGELRADGEVEARGVPLALVAPILPALPWYEPEHARLDASLKVKSEGIDRIAFEGDAALHGVALSSPRLAPEPIDGVELSMRGRGQWLPLARRLEVDEAAVALGEVAASLSGAIELGDEHYLLDVDARLPSTPCTDAVRAIPAALLGDMRHARWEGRISGGLKLHADSRDLEALELDLDVGDECTFVEVPVMADLRRFREPFTHSVVEPDDTIFEMETGPGTLAWTRLDDISPFLVYAVLAHEDASFFSHEGFSPGHVRNALARNLAAGRYVLGASTITMQLVKNVFLRREKTLARKIQEVLLTWWVERVMTKRDVLELYLNVIEFGPGIYGVRNGARHYFNRLPGELSPAEAVYLSTILPNPKRYHSHFEKGEVPSGWLGRLRSIFERLRQKGWYSPAAVAYGLAELDRFRFVSEGTVTAAREIAGAARPLPSGDDEAIAGWEEGEEWWGDEDAQAPTVDADADPAPDSDADPESALDLTDEPPPAPD